MKKSSNKPMGFSTQYFYILIQLKESIHEYKKIIDKMKSSEVSEAKNKAHLQLKYHYRTESIRYNLNVLSCVLLEALINTWLALRTTDSQFASLERMNLIEKWITLPTLFIKKYRIDKSGRLYFCLQHIIETRNFIVHMKPMVIGLNKTLRKGNYKDGFSKEILKPDEYFNTPFQLWINLHEQEKDPQIKQLMGTFKLELFQYHSFIRKIQT